MTRRGSEVLTRQVTRFPVKRVKAQFSVEPHGDGAYRCGTVPTREGFVRVESWPAKTTYTLILGGIAYERTDPQFTASQSLGVTAGIFAKTMARDHAAWRAGEPQEVTG